MKHCDNTVLTLAFLLLAAPLTACQSVGTAMSEMGDRVAKMEMPDFKPRTDKDSLVEESRIADHDTKRPERTDPFKEAAFSEQDDTSDRKETVVLAGKGNCPPVNMVEELKSFHQFPDPSNPSPSAKISELTLTGLQTDCAFKGDNVIIDIDLAMVGKLGDGAKLWNTSRYTFAYPYFIAITTPSGNVIAKEVFAASVTYPKNGDNVQHSEHLRHVIPINGSYDTDHEIMIGFQLTDEELAYNRALLTSTAAAAAPELPAAAIDPAAPPPVVPSPEDTLTPVPAKQAATQSEQLIDVKPARKPDAAPAQAAVAPSPAAAPVVKVEEVALEAPASQVDDVAPAAGGNTASEPIEEFIPESQLQEEAAELEEALEEVAPGPVTPPAPEPAATEPAQAPQPEPQPVAEERRPVRSNILPPVPVKEEVTPDVAPDAVYIPQDPDPATVIDITAD